MSTITPIHGGKKSPQDPQAAFVPGAALTPGAGLRSWLDQQAAAKKQVRLPVILKVLPIGIDQRGARIGSGLDALEITVSDSRLGMSLADRVRGKYPKGAATVAAWLEGDWQDGTLLINRFGAVIPDADLAAADHAEVAQ